MSSLTVTPQHFGPMIARRPAGQGVGSAQTNPASARPDGEPVRQEGGEFLRVLMSTLAVEGFLIALPFLALLPLLAVAVLLGGVAALFAGAV